MATYKVPQDVEAEDKLLGPFSFRQFIYLIIAAAGVLIAWGLSRLFIGLVIIPIPVILFFLILALPLKKDQPMETYLTAVVRFWLKPRVRIWDPEGNLINVEITVPQIAAAHLTKDFSGNEAAQRLAYLSQVVDTQGWATRGLTSALDNSRLNDTVVAEAQSAEDMLDDSGSVAQNLDTMINESDQARKASVLQTMQQSLRTQDATQQVAVTQTTTAAPPQQPILEQPTPITPVQSQTEPAQDLSYNPYPSAIHQRVITPAGQNTVNQPVATIQQPAPAPPSAVLEPIQPQASSETPVSPDIMRLATSRDLSISTIAREAERLQKKHLDEDEEVVVSLR